MGADLFSETASRMESDDDISDVLYQFEFEDVYYIQLVKKAIKALLHREDLTPNQVKSIAKMLLGLERLPLQTPGLDLHIGLSEKNEGEVTSYDVYLQECEFRTESGGYVSGPMGSDSISGPTFEVGQRFRSCDLLDIYDLTWPYHFTELSANGKLRIEDDSDDTILDWEHPDGSIFWEWIDSHPWE